MITKKLPELLAPCSDTDAFYAALAAGADAVYLGLSAFNARVYAKNFDEEALKSCVTYAHLLGRRVYVTLNTLLSDRETDAFLEAAGVACRAGVDAVIVADLGGARLLRRYFPALEMHASTQMTVTSAAGCEPLKALGFTRVVPARELSLADIRTLSEKSGLETEVFLHGALCVSYSGQCLLSSLVGGRSGNRGACAQPCRLPYNGGYPLSLRDLSLAEHMEELLESGVSSLKIEGRMKSPLYVYHTVSLYRRLLDEGRNASPAEMEEARRVFSRGGFTDGYFTGKKMCGMTGVRSDAEKAESRELSPIETQKAVLPLTLSFRAVSGAPAVLSLSYQGVSVTVTGDIPTLPEKHPLTGDAAREQLRKLGGTPFVLSENSSFTVEDGLYLSIPALNQLRRRGVETLLSCFARPMREIEISAKIGTAPTMENGERVDPSPAIPSEGGRVDLSPAGESERSKTIDKKQDKCKSEFTFSAYCYAPEQLDALPPECESYLPLFRLAESRRTPVGVALPPVVFDSEEPEVLRLLRDAASRGVTHALCGNLSHIAYAREAGLVPVGDFRLNICNRETREFYCENGVTDAVLSPELLPAQCRHIGGRAIVYGRIPLMLLERCFIKENFGCEQCKNAALTDRRGASFPLIREYPHRNLLLNSLPTYMGDKKNELLGLVPHFIFTLEAPAEVFRVLSSYWKGTSLPFPVRRMGRMEPRTEKTEKNALIKTGGKREVSRKLQNQKGKKPAFERKEEKRFPLNRKNQKGNRK